MTPRPARPTSGTATPARRPAARGMSLVDLMVGLTLGMFLLAVTGAIFQGSKSTFVAQESSARLQENGRFALDTVAADLRMSGFRGCGAGGEVVNTLATPDALAYNFGQPIWGSRAGSGGWTPALQAPVTGLGPDSAGDVLVVRRSTGRAWSLIGTMADASAPLPITPTGGFTQGDLLVVADCAGAAAFQATNATPGPSGAIAHTVGAAGVVPGVTTANLGRAFSNDAVVWRMQTVSYFLAPSERHTGQRALWSHTTPVYDGTTALAELVSGVERLGVTYGIDSNADASADRFVAADAVTEWGQVVSARVELVLAGNSDGTAQNASTAQPYVFDGVTVVPTDKRLRTVMSSLVSLRNAVP